MIRPFRILPLLVGLVAFATSGLAQPPADPDGGRSVEILESGAVVRPGGVEARIAPPTLAFLRAMEARHGGAKAVRGEFRQIKTSDIFLEEFESKGVFVYVEPDLFRCDFEPPDESTNLVVRDAIYVHFPSIAQVERYRFATPEERDQQMHTMTLGFGLETDKIVREYDVISTEEGLLALAKELRDEGFDPAKTTLIHARPAADLAETSPFTLVKLWIDKESLRPQKIWYEDASGERTEILVDKVEFDPPVDRSIFEPKFPPGTEFIDKSDL